MSKLIIYNKSSVSDCSAIELVAQVVAMGRISMSGGRPQYCFVTVLQHGSSEVQVISMLNKESDRFIVSDKWRQKS
jgi:hypothetical protein